MLQKSLRGQAHSRLIARCKIVARKDGKRTLVDLGFTRRRAVGQLGGRKGVGANLECSPTVSENDYSVILVTVCIR
jgi:hypothetical protein